MRRIIRIIIVKSAISSKKKKTLNIIENFLDFDQIQEEFDSNLEVDLEDYHEIE